MHSKRRGIQGAADRSPGVPEEAFGIEGCDEDVEHKQRHTIAQKRSIVHWGAQIGCTLLSNEYHAGDRRIERYRQACTQSSEVLGSGRGGPFNMMHDHQTQAPKHHASGVCINAASTSVACSLWPRFKTHAVSSTRQSSARALLSEVAFVMMRQGAEAAPAEAPIAQKSRWS